MHGKMSIPPGFQFSPPNSQCDMQRNAESLAVTSSTFMSHTYAIINSRMKTDFKKVLRRFPKGIWASEFPSHYKATLGLDLDFRALGYLNFLDLVADLPEIFVRRQLVGCKNDFLLYDVETYDEVLIINEPKMPVLTLADKFQRIKSNIGTLLQANPEGISTEDFYQFYKLNFDELLKPQEFGFNCLNSFLLDVKDSVPLKLVFLKNKLMVYFDVAKCNVSNDPIFCVPEDVVDIITSYKRQPWPSSEIFSDYVDVYLASASDPVNVWMNLKGEDSSVALDKLQEDLGNFYDGINSDHYCMHNNHIVQGAVCAGKFQDDKWYRIRISEIFKNDAVQAFFVDFGKLDQVPKLNLRYLKKSFFDLPSQAIKAKLSDIKPMTHAWAKNSGLKLMEKFAGKPLMAHVNAFSKQDFTLFVYLFYVRGTNDITILNDLMVIDGMATGCDDASEFQKLVFNPKPFSSIYKVASVNALHCYKHLSNEYQLLNSLSASHSIQRDKPALSQNVDNSRQRFGSTGIGLTNGCLVNNAETSQAFSKVCSSSPSESSSGISTSSSSSGLSSSNVPQTLQRNIANLCSSVSNGLQISSNSAPHLADSFPQAHQVSSSLYSWNRVGLEMPTLIPQKMKEQNVEFLSTFTKEKSNSDCSIFVDGFIKPPTSPSSVDGNENQESEYPFKKFSVSHTSMRGRPRNKNGLQVNLRKPLAMKSVFKVDKEICGCQIHIIKLVDTVHISSSDIARILWGREESTLVYDKVRPYTHIPAYPISLYATNNEFLFEQLVKNNVCGIQKTKYKGVETLMLVVYSLVAALPIFQLFGNSNLVSEMKYLLQQYDLQNYNLLFQESADDCTEKNGK